jgi:hypothetical protein
MKQIKPQTIPDIYNPIENIAIWELPETYYSYILEQIYSI